MKAKNMALCGLFSALLAICAWIAVPFGDTAISLQTFGIFLCLGLLGGKRGSISVFLYLMLGAVGLPVFSGFRGGMGALLGVTGGYLTGFLGCSLLYWLLTSLFPRHPLPAMGAGLILCYLLGSLWYAHIYAGSGGAASLPFIIIKCVLPFVLPDVIKLFLAWKLSQKLKPFVY